VSKLLAPPGTKDYFYRTVATFALVIVGLLAWYGLHRDVAATKNPCIDAKPSAACVRYVCTIGDILAVPESKTCKAHDGGPQRRP